MEEEAIREYLRCFRQAGAMRAAFDDYRAGATIDLEHDGADRDRTIAVPTLVLGGESARRAQAAGTRGAGPVEGHAVPACGHFIPEEQPAAVVEAILTFCAASR